MLLDIQNAVLNLKQIENDLTLVQEIPDLNVTESLETIKSYLSMIRCDLEKMI